MHHWKLFMLQLNKGLWC